MRTRRAAITVFLLVLGIGVGRGAISLGPEVPAPAAPPAAVPSSTAPPSEPEPLRLKLTLSDGSQIIGVPSATVWPATTSFTDMQVPLERIRTADFSRERAEVVLVMENGDRLTAVPKFPEFGLTTKFGKVTIPLALVTHCAVLPGGNRAVLRDGLVLSFSFNQVEGTGVADESERGHTGTLHDGAKIVTDAHRGPVLELDGRAAHLRVAGSPDFQLTNATVSVWLQPDSWAIPENTAQPILASVTPNSREGGLEFKLDHPSQATWAGCTADNRQVIAAGLLHVEVGDRQWHHLAGTLDYRDGRYLMRVYLDGELLKEETLASEALAYGGQGLDVGISYDSPAAKMGMNCARQYKGRMDDLLLFNRALSDEEILRLYNAGK